MPATQLASQADIHSLYSDHHGWLQTWLRGRLAWRTVEQVQASFMKVPGEIALPALRGAAVSRRESCAVWGELVLNTATSVDVRYSNDSRLIHLHQGGSNIAAIQGSAHVSFHLKELIGFSGSAIMILKKPDFVGKRINCISVSHFRGHYELS